MTSETEQSVQATKSPTPDPKAKKSASGVPDALMVLAVTGVAYLLVFSYEVGFCRYFGIPNDLIRPDLTTLLTDAALALAIAYIIIQVTYLLAITTRGRQRPILKTLCVYAILLGFAVVVAWIEDFRGLDAFYPLIMIMMWFFIDFIMPWYYSERGFGPRSFQVSFEDTQRYKEDLAKPFSNAIKDNGLVVVVNLVLLVMLATGIASWIGKLNAKVTDTFLCRESTRKEVVLKVYGGAAITARIDDNRKVYPEFRFVKLEGETNVFTLKRIGRLKPQLPDNTITDARVGYTNTATVQLASPVAAAASPKVQPVTALPTPSIRLKRP